MNVDMIRTVQNGMRPYAPLLLRLTLGVVFIAHGIDKLFGTFGGGGLQETANQFAELGLNPPLVQALMAGLMEAGGGVLVTLGLFTRLGGLMIASTMIVAIAVVHGPNGLFARDGGFEYPLVALGAALSLALSGGGKLALDRIIAKRLLPNERKLR
jgi:putative oxidoreductase